MRMRHLMFGTVLLVACGGGERDSAAPAREPDAPERSRGAAEAPAPGGGGPAGATRIEVTGSVEGRELEVSGTGECEHSPEGSIYERPASLWTVHYAGGDGDPLQYLNLTFWRERAGAESLTLALHTDERTHRIATTAGGERHGSGTATLTPSADGGTFVVEGESEEGAGIKLRVRCARFTALVAEGG